MRTPQRRDSISHLTQFKSFRRWTWQPITRPLLIKVEQHGKIHNTKQQQATPI